MKVTKQIVPNNAYPQVYIDVDLTLIDLQNRLLPHVRERIEELANKYVLIAWSAAGAAYADDVLRFHGLRQYFSYVLSKPFILIDDTPETILARTKVVKINKYSWASIWEAIFSKEVY